MFSTVVSSTPVGSFSSTPIFRFLASVPIESTSPQNVDVCDEHRGNEQDHFDQREGTHLVERHRPRIEEDDLDVEDDEQHGGDVVLHRESAAADRLWCRFDAALI